MFNNTHCGASRLSEWRKVRRDKNITTPQLLIDRFAEINMQQRYLDFYTPESWPGVFEIVNDGIFDQTGITLIMAATMDQFGFINADTYTIPVISNHITGTEGAVLLYDNFCYNFLPGEIVTEQYMRDNSTIYDTHIITKDNLFN